MYHQHGLISSTISDAGEHSTDWRIYGTTPIWKTIHEGFTWHYGYKFRQFTNSADYDFSSYGILQELFPDMFPTHNQIEYYVHTFSLEFSGYKRLLSKDLFNYYFTLYAGKNTPRTDAARDIVEALNSDGNIFKSQLVLDYRKLFLPYFEFHTNITLQKASRSLNFAEQIPISGANGVRGNAACAGDSFMGDRGKL